MEGLFQFISKIFWPVEWLISWIMVIFHNFFTLIGFPKGPGIAWILSIVFLTIFVRICIFYPYTRQMESMARTQAMQPELKKIREKYKGRRDIASQEAMRRETMELQKKYHANPMASCIPLLIQAPIFIALFDGLQSITKIAIGQSEPIGAFTKSVSQEIANTEFINVQLSTMFNNATAAGKITIGIFVALMCLTMFYSQFHTIQFNTPRSVSGAQRKTQWVMAIIFPLMYIWSGSFVPFGVLVYWLTTNIWTVGQTIWQVHVFPTPGSPAADKKKIRLRKREEKRRERQGLPSLQEEALQQAEAAQKERSEKGFQRAQPTKKKPKK